MAEEIGCAPEAFHARQALSLCCSLHDTRKVGFKFSQVVTWRGNVDIVECPVGDIELGKKFKGRVELVICNLLIVTGVDPGELASPYTKGVETNTSKVVPATHGKAQVFLHGPAMSREAS